MQPAGNSPCSSHSASRCVASIQPLPPLLYVESMGVGAMGLSLCAGVGSVVGSGQWLGHLKSPHAHPRSSPLPACISPPPPSPPTTRPPGRECVINARNSHPLPRPMLLHLNCCPIKHPPPPPPPPQHCRSAEDHPPCQTQPAPDKPHPGGPPQGRVGISARPLINEDARARPCHRTGD